MRARLFILFFILAITAVGQEQGDTITIKTFNYSQTYGINQWSPGIRDTVIDFSVLPNISFERVLMTYNMRCKDAKVSNANNRDRGCGEWDISCNTYFHDSSSIDSVGSKHPNYIISGFGGTTFDYTTQPLYNYYRYRHKKVEVDAVNSETTFPLFTTANQTAEFKTSNAGKVQILYTKDELNNAGFSAGEIDGLSLNAKGATDIGFLRVRIKHASLNALDNKNPEILDFKQVLFSNFSFSQGANKLMFIKPFEWNGTDNIIVEFSFTNGENEKGIAIEGSDVAKGKAISAYNNHYIDVSANGHVDLPTKSLSTINKEITVSFWAYGSDELPTGTSVLYGAGANGERDLNIHLPWSNSNIYWDCGNDGSNYDRIEKKASVLDIKGKWNHWAFTKDVNSGTMSIFLNGKLWHSATGKTREIDIAKFVLGKNSVYSNNYKGSLNELRVWDKALTETEIADWMNISVTNEHPNYSNLVAYFPFNEGSGSYAIDAISLDTAKANESVVWKTNRGVDLDKFFSYDSTIPNLTLLQGDYDTSVITETVLDSLEILPKSVTEYEIKTHPGQLKNDEVVEIKSYNVWRANPQIIYVGNSTTKYDEIPVTKEGTFEIEDLSYFRRWPTKYEIMSFVTPYGVNLDLGKNGKTWTFDVTDYLPVFNGKKRLTMEHGGQWMEDMDIQFHFIVGTPPRDVLDINQIWRSQRVGYATINNNTYFAPRSIALLPNAEHFEIRSVITGHGQEGEFTPRNHHLFVDGEKKYSWEVWTECSENPIYPQGGTWVYDRAGWCPGAPSDMQRSNITEFVTPGSEVELDYDVDVASGASNYFANHQLVSYGAINHQLDARLLEVKTPSNRVEFARFNSICHAPTVIIQNTGSTDLNTATIAYWINDASEPMIHEWTGQLGFLETAEVSLNTFPSFWKEADETVNVFHAEIRLANGTADEYANNNVYHSEFSLPEVLPNAFLIQFKTNNQPQENSYEVLDYAGNVVFSRANMTANTVYTDTLNLGLGCYTLNVTDFDGDGISWWANNDGNGTLMLRETNNRVIKNFNPDFGGSIHYNFTIDYPLSYNDVHPTSGLSVYPNPANNFLNVDFEGSSEQIILQLFDVNGKVILNESRSLIEGSMSKSIDLIDLSKGLYIVKVLDGNTIYTERFTKK